MRVSANFLSGTSTIRARVARALTAALAVPLSIALIAPSVSAQPVGNAGAASSQAATEQEAGASAAAADPQSRGGVQAVLDALAKGASPEDIARITGQAPEAIKKIAESEEGKAALENLNSANPQIGGGGGGLFMPPPMPGAPRIPFREDIAPKVPNLPAGVSVEKISWYTDRHAIMHIKSAAMPEKPIQVELLLPRDWYRDKERSFPSVYHLDGLRAYDDYSGWMRVTNIQRFYEDKNLLVVMPAGGEASFYSDWNEPDNGKNYKWETFLTKELVPVMTNYWRANNDRGIFGISMGGTAAFNVAAHSPDLWKFAGALSGYLDTTSPGMPQAISTAMRNSGGYDATKMWGRLGSERWKDNDPKLNIDKLKGMQLYISAGNGNTGQWDQPSEFDPTKPNNPGGYALEVLSRMTAETFIYKAKEKGVNPVVKFRESGTHSWPYWQFEVSQAFPVLADALQLSEADRATVCKVGGAIEMKVASMPGIGTCLSDEYPVGDGGVAQDFTGGTAFWHPDTGAEVVWGRILNRYSAMGGAGSQLGFPVTSERSTPDNAGRFVHFQHGAIYWTPETDAHEVVGDMLNAWADSGWEKGPLGFPVANAKPVPGGSMQEFQKGFLIKTGDKPARIVRGAIAHKYKELGGADSELGLPVDADETALERGAVQRFEHGNIYWTPEHGAVMTPKSDIFDHWGATGYENGPFGYPVGPFQPVRAGGLEQQFEGGWIRQLNGKIVEERN